jgi:RND family efflux transporter MFP subunit
MNMRKMTATIILSLIVIIVFVIAILRLEHHQIPSLKKHQFVSAPIDTIMVKNRAVPSYYQAVGSIESTVKSQLESQITATVKAVNVFPNQHVKKGQVLVILDNRNSLAHVSEAELAVQAADARYQQILLHIKRIKQLSKLGYVSADVLDKNQGLFLQNKANLLKTRKALRAAQVALSYCQIKAPSDGVIINKYVDPGDQATPGKTLLKFRSKKGVRMTASIPEELINKVKIGGEYPLKINSDKIVLTGIVNEIIPSIDPETRSFTIKASINKLAQSSKIYPGMYARLFIPISIKQVITVPESYIIERGQLKMAAVWTNHHVKMVYITTGRTLPNNQIEVLSGINPGDKLVSIGKLHAG